MRPGNGRAATCESSLRDVRERKRPALLWTGREIAALTERGRVTRTKDISNAERDRRICMLRRNGFTYSEIAQMEGLSRVRVGQIVKEFKLTPDQYIRSTRLREWARRNKNSKYIPEALLEAWGFEIESTL